MSACPKCGKPVGSPNAQIKVLIEAGYCLCDVPQSVIEANRRRMSISPPLWKDGTRFIPPLKTVGDVLSPNMSLLIKLGSLLVHQEEYMSQDGHAFDRLAMDTLRNDPEVVEWLDEMTKLAYLPVKRNERRVHVEERRPNPPIITPTKK